MIYYVHIQLDATRKALSNMGHGEIEIIVSETGWPHIINEADDYTDKQNAASYVGNLVNHLKKNEGTPLVKGKSIDTYIHELFDPVVEELGPGYYAYGLFSSSLSNNYNSDFLKETPDSLAPTPSGEF